MTIKSTGSISINNINLELGLASGTNNSLNLANVRTLLGKPSGTISLSNAYGKSASSVFNGILQLFPNMAIVPNVWIKY